MLIALLKLFAAALIFVAMNAVAAVGDGAWRQSGFTDYGPLIAGGAAQLLLGAALWAVLAYD